MILVTGGTGTVGREVARQLVEAGAPTRVLVRTPEKAVVLRGLKAEFMMGDSDRPGTLGPALKGVEALFLLTGADPRQAEVQSLFVKMAKEAGVRKIVKLSALGAADDAPTSLGRWHRRTEKEIEASGLAWTHLRPHFFMQNTLGFAPSIKKDGSFSAPLGEARIAMVDARDVAAVAVKALTQPGHDGKIHEVTGPAAVSFGEAAAAIASATGREVQYVPASFAEFRRTMIGIGFHAWLVDDLVKLYEVFSAGRGAAVSPTVEKVAGRPGVPFSRFAQDYAVIFK